VASVLVVDDDSAFLDLAARILSDMGIEVVATVHDATAALRVAGLKTPDAFLVDVGLPDLDGVELGRRLTTLPSRPRVVLTSCDRDVLGFGAGDGDPRLPFVPKAELASDSMRRLLLGE
jgi:CheY-like chemotaxis protein